MNTVVDKVKPVDTTKPSKEKQMTEMDLDKLIKQQQELAQKEAELAKQIAEIQTAKKQEVITRLLEEIKKYDIQKGDLFPSTSGQGKGAPFVYKDPNTGSIYARRGPKPDWFLRFEQMGAVDKLIKVNPDGTPYED